MQTFQVCCYVFFLLEIYISEVSAINVALHKPAKYCESIDLSNNLVDGNYGTFEVVTERCDKNANIMVNLGDNYIINYVVVTKGSNTKLEKALDHFLVLNYAIKYPYYCSQYPKKSLEAARKMRVNCIHNNMHFIKIQIMMASKIGFDIAEVEVHSLATPNNSAKIYRGCFKTFHALKIRNNYKRCFQYCASLNYGVVGLKKGSSSSCLCGIDYDESTEVNGHNCKFRCGKTKDPCGGPSHYSIYLVIVRLPFFRGCCRYNARTDNLFTAFKMSVSDCLRLCENSTFIMMKGGGNCRCQDDEICVQSYTNPRYCTVPCTTNCNTSYAMVYGTCKDPNMDSIKCSKLFRCDDKWNEYGECAECESGFTGEHCLNKEVGIATVAKLEGDKKTTEEEYDDDDEEEEEDGNQTEPAQAESQFPSSTMQIVIILVTLNVVGLGAYIVWRVTRKQDSGTSSSVVSTD